MKYTKHYTWNEWKKFNKPVEPDNTFTFTNFKTQKTESYDSLTMQEVLLSKYIIILDKYEPKWTRRYSTLKKYINQKNFDKGIKQFNGMVNAFSSGLGETSTTRKSSKKNQDVLWGKNKSSGVSIWGDAPKKKYKRRPKKPNSLNIWSNKKTSIW
jgi:hypothetical protein